MPAKRKTDETAKTEIANQFFYIGDKTWTYAPFGGRNTPVNWTSFANWLSDELDCDPDDIECGDDIDGKEPVLVAGKIVGCFGGSLDHVPQQF